MWRCVSVPGQPNEIAYAATNEPVITTAVDEHLDDAPPVHGERLREPHRLAGAERPPLDVGEEARELHEQREREDDADDRPADVVEHVVGEAREADAGRDQREQRDRVPLGEPVAHEPVRGVVAAALVDRPPFEQARRR